MILTCRHVSFIPFILLYRLSSFIVKWVQTRHYVINFYNRLWYVFHRTGNLSKFYRSYLHKLNLTEQNTIQAKLYLFLITYAPHHGGVRKSVCIVPCILNVVTTWKKVLSFTPSFLTRKIIPRHQLATRVSWTQIWFGHYAGEKISPPLGNRTPNPPSSSL
jgi:hypothetical protein